MTSLMPYAVELARNPPLDAYNKVMRLVSDEQLSGLGPEPSQNDEGWKAYQRKREECLQVASKYEIMRKQNGKDVADFSVTSICDFMAMCTMMIGAGIERIEALKQAINGREETTVVKTDAGDHAYLFLNKGANAKAFAQILGGWCQLENNGVVQFKFPAAGDFHTFTVERISNANKETRFIVYQAYQNTYSLAHFLGLQRVRNDKVLGLLHEQVWASSKDSPEFLVKYKGDYQRYLKLGVNPQLDNIDAAINNVGRKQELDADALKVNVIEPLAEMLGGEIMKRRYVKLTGSPTSSSRIRSDFMTVLMCHQVSPAAYRKNCEALYKAPAVTPYVDCGPKPKKKN